MNEFQKNLIDKYLKAFHQSKDQYEHMPQGVPLKEQVYMEQRYEYDRLFVADLISMYLGKDVRDNVYRDVYNAKNANELIDKQTLTKEQYDRIKPYARKLCSATMKVHGQIPPSKMRDECPDIAALEKRINSELKKITGYDDYDIIGYLSADVPSIQGFNDLIEARKKITNK